MLRFVPAEGRTAQSGTYRGSAQFLAPIDGNRFGVYARTRRVFLDSHSAPTIQPSGYFRQRIKAGN